MAKGVPQDCPPDSPGRSREGGRPERWPVASFLFRRSWASRPNAHTCVLTS